LIVHAYVPGVRISSIDTVLATTVKTPPVIGILVPETSTDPPVIVVRSVLPYVIVAEVGHVTAGVALTIVTALLTLVVV